MDKLDGCRNVGTIDGVDRHVYVGGPSRVVARSLRQVADPVVNERAILKVYISKQLDIILGRVVGVGCFDQHQRVIW